MPLVVATANVRHGLDREQARTTVAAVLEHTPDLIGLQEWHPWFPSRWRLLREFTDYTWFTPWLGGCAVGVRRPRTIRESHGVWLSRPGRADRSGRFLHLEPPRRASVVVTSDDLTFVVYHLASQVQGDDDAYRPDRPRLVLRHQHEASALRSLVATARPPAYACGDSNFHGFRMQGLVSSWEGRTGGTRGARRQIDDIHGPAAPVDVTTVVTPSDHLAVVATYA